ncbi:hypothetical protein BT63DRAFT_410242 [Microthyrium microscopicum]|uniref:F-box domain-containing protein n=1 Tax=Microthyrium microscopicum TaxID=703497 RepID=A0A6A6ULU3_9PEZI|nr:hypothetical protein BT63DRAFT_410242 [Microthyrium microscopicum]
MEVRQAAIGDESGKGVASRVSALSKRLNWSNMAPMHIFDLPNEVVDHFLNFVPFKDLFPLTLVSKAFCQITISHIQDRHNESLRPLTECGRDWCGWRTPNRSMAYRIFQPADRYMSPLVYVTPSEKSPTSLISPFEYVSVVEQLHDIHTRYTSLQPANRSSPHARPFTEERNMRDAPRGLMAASSGVARRIALDPEERFTQMLFKVELVEKRRVSVPTAEGVIRVFRDWLENWAKAAEREAEEMMPTMGSHQEWMAATKGQTVLWLGEEQKLVGFRVAVLRPEARDGQAPQEGAYWIKFCDLIVRTSQIVRSTEALPVEEPHLGFEPLKMQLRRSSSIGSLLPRMRRSRWASILDGDVD